MNFNRLSLATLVAVYVLIAVGGIVRSTGSGMGCPDWPTCFGKWVPPTTAEELPDNYKEQYASYRDKKNRRFAHYLSALGFKETAEKILRDESILEEADFNATKTWIEYINRLVGVIIGFLIFAVFVFSIKYWKTDRAVTWIALLTFVLVGFQGWIGSIVVSTNLTPWTVTVHMFLAMAVVFLLVYLVARSTTSDNSTSRSPVTTGLLVACMMVLLVQILLGTQVREAIDRVAALARNTWIEKAGLDFIIHRSFSWVVLLLHVALSVQTFRTWKAKLLPVALISLVAATVLTGAGMAWLDVPPVLQPLHLLLATVTFGIQSFMILRTTANVNLALTKES